MAILEGQGGGKKGGGKNAEDTLRSVARAVIVDAISEGPIEGLVNGPHSVYVDRTPLANLTDCTHQLRRGLPDDAPLAGINGTEAYQPIGVEVTQTIGPQTRSIVDTELDVVRVHMSLNNLYHVDSKGALKTANGGWNIDVRAAGRTFERAVTMELNNEKCTSAVQFQNNIKLSDYGPGPWDIRVSARYGDRTEDKTYESLTWEGMSLVTHGKFTYPHTAVVGLDLNSEHVGTSVPKRHYHVRGRRIQVPSNYTPATRSYATGSWDGTFATTRQFSNNPAWVFWDIVRNKQFGLGNELGLDVVSKWQLYDIARHCDVMVPSGYYRADGTAILEPRYTFNGVILDKQQAIDALRSITAVWRGMGFYSASQFHVTYDSPKDAAHIYGPANVKDGRFEYSSTSVKARHTVIMVRFNDANDFFEPTIEPVIDDEGVHALGWKEKTLALTGCSSRSLARRYGRWVLDTEKNETETVTFTVGMDSIHALPGEIIAINDPRRAQVRMSGRIAAVLSGSTIRMDQVLDPVVNKTGVTVSIHRPDGTIFRRTANVQLNGSTINIGAGNAPEELVGCMYVISATNVAPREYRIISIDEQEDSSQYQITALRFDRTKFARVERGITVEPRPVTVDRTQVAPVRNLAATQRSYTDGGGIRTDINLNWLAPLSTLVREYRVTVDTPTTRGVQVSTTALHSATYATREPGEYTFSVRTVNYTGRVSAPARVTLTVVGEQAFSVGRVEDLVNAVTGRATGGFTGADLRLRWRNMVAVSDDPTVPLVEQDPAVYASTLIRVYNGTTLLREAQVRGNTYTYAIAMNREDSAAAGFPSARRSLRVEVSVVDRQGRVSLPAQISMANPAPAAPVMRIGSAATSVNLDWDEVTDPDLDGYLVWISNTAAFDPAATPTAVVRGTSFTMRANPAREYFATVAAFDAFGRETLNYSSRLSVSTGIDWSDDTPPAVPTGLTLSSTSERLTASWNPNTEGDFAQYDVLIATNGGNEVGFTTSTPRYSWDLPPNTPVTVRLRAMDVAGNRSNYCATVSHTTARDLIPPAVPTGFAARPGFSTIMFSWNANIEPDFSHYELYESLATTAPTATTAATYRSPANTAALSGLAEGVTRYYWLRAVDTSGNASAWTTRLDVRTVSLSDTSDPSALPTGLALTTRLTGEQSIVGASWLAAANAVSYEIGITEGTNNEVVSAVGELRYEWFALRNVSYSVRVRGINALGRKSNWTAPLTILSARDTVAPGQTVGVSARAGVASAVLRWTASTATDLASYEIYQSTTTTAPTAATAPTHRVLATTTIVGDLVNGTQYYWWVRAVDSSGNLGAWSARVDARPTSVSTLIEEQIAQATWATNLGFIVQRTDAALPTTNVGSTISWQGKLYTWDGQRYVSASALDDVSFENLSGQISLTHLPDGLITVGKIAPDLNSLILAQGVTAQGDVTAAAGHAATSLAHANDAGESATAAAGSATNAATSAGNASTSATQASQSSTNAAGSATNAATSATTAATTLSTAQAALSASTALVSVPTAETNAFGLQATGLPASYVTLPATSYGVDTDGPYVRTGVVTGTSQIYTRGVVSSTQTDRVYRVTARVKLTGDASLRIRAIFMNASGANISGTAAAAVPYVATSNVATISMVIGRVSGGLVTQTVGNATAWDTSTILRFGIEKQATAVATQMQVYEILVEDVTQADLAFRQATLSAASASASAGSATAAKTSEDAAGVQRAAAVAASVVATDASNLAIRTVNSAGQLPSTFEASLANWTQDRTGSPTAVAVLPAARATFVGNDAILGECMAWTPVGNAGENIMTRGVVPAAGKVYRVTASFRVVSSAIAAGVSLNFTAQHLGANHTGTNAFFSPGRTFAAGNTIHTLSMVIGGTAGDGIEHVHAAMDTHTFVRYGLRLNENNAAVIRINAILVEEVTSIVRSQTSARLAASSATSSTEAASTATQATQLASLVLGGGMHRNPIFQRWNSTDTAPLDFSIAGTGQGTLTKVPGKYGNAVRLTTTATASVGPYLQTVSSQHTGPVNPAKVMVTLEIEPVSGTLAGTLIELGWTVGTTTSWATRPLAASLETGGGIQTFQTVLERPAAASGTVVNLIARIHASHASGGTTRAVGDIIVHRFDIQEVRADSYIDQQLRTKATVDGITQSSYLMRVKAGGASAGFEMVAASNPTGPASAIRMSADEILLDGTVRAPQLAAGAITTSKIAVGDLTNLFGDPLYTDLSAWFLNGATMRKITATTPTTSGGEGLLEVTAPVAGYRQVQSPRFAVEPGTQLFSVTTARAAAAGVTIRTRIIFYTQLAGGTTVSAVDVASTTSTAYTSLFGTVTVPAGAFAAELAYVVQSTNANQIGYFGGASVRRKTGGVLIENGTISGSHLILTEEIITNAAQIKEATIGEAHITGTLSAGILRADTALANSITIDGTALSTVREGAGLGAQNPATRINNGTTTIDPGRILIAGAGSTATTLDDWRGGTNQTEINGGRIATDSVSARSIQIVDTSTIVPDANFMDPASWRPHNSATLTFGVDPNPNVGTIGGRRIVATINPAHTLTSQYSGVESSIFPAQGGVDYSVRQMIWTGAPASGNPVPTIRVDISWRGVDGTEVGVGILPLSTVNGWREVSTLAAGALRAPATAVSGILRVLIRGDAATGTNVILGRPHVNRQSDVLTIADRAITGAKLIATENVITESAQMGLLTVDDGSIVKLDAAKLIAGSVMTPSVTVDGRSLASLNGDFLFDDTSQDWTKITGVGTFYRSNPETAGVTGSSTLVMNPNGLQWMESNEKIPYDPNKLYRVTFSIRRAATGTGNYYLGLVGWNSTRLQRISTNGDNTSAAAHYMPGSAGAAQSTVPTGFTDYVCYFKGHSAVVGGQGTIASPRTMRTGVRFISPMAIFNHNLTTGGTLMVLNHAKIETVNEDVAELVNSGSVSIDPGRITIKGETKLTHWVMGGDSTSINGGRISADTVSTNALRIGNRNLTLTSIKFEHNRSSADVVAANWLWWSGGTIQYINDAGDEVYANIPSGNVQWTSGVRYVYWNKPSTANQVNGFNSSFQTTTDRVAAFGENRVIIATYQGGRFLDADYGRTVIDGLEVKTGTLTASAVNTNSFSAEGLSLFNGELRSRDFNASTGVGWRITKGEPANGTTPARPSTLQIPNAIIDTLKIADGSVTTQWARNDFELEITLSYDARIIILTSARIMGTFSTHTTRYELFRNGVRVEALDFSVDEYTNPYVAIRGMTLAAGVHRFNFGYTRVSGASTTTQYNTPRIAIFGGYK